MSQRHGTTRRWRSLLTAAMLPALVLALTEAHHGPHWDAAEASAAAERLVFAEAVHPGEALHIDAASAPEARSCAACLHRLQAGHARLAAPTGLSAPVQENALPASAPRELASFLATGASPRGPPFLTS